MAAINRTHSTQFLDDMIRKKDRINFTVAFQDRRQWPALGQSTESEQKKLAGGKLDGTCPKPRLQSVSSSSTSTSTSISADGQSNKSTTTDSDKTSSGQNAPDVDKPNSPENMRKKNGKTKWIPLDLPPQGHGISLQEKLRMKRRQEMGLPPSDRFRHYAYTSGPRSSFYPHQMNDQHAESETYCQYGNGPQQQQQQQRYERRSDVNSSYIHRRPTPQHHSLLKPRHVTFSKKMYGLRNKNIMYDSDYTGRECDQRSDGTAEDGLNAQGYWEDGYYYAGDGNETPIDMTEDYLYYGGGVMDGYPSSATVAYPEDHEGYGFYSGIGQGASSGFMVDGGENGYVDNSDAVLKEMVKLQIEYYFSTENLQKDFFLRRSMSKDGWVMLNLLASFQRVQSLTQDFHFLCEAVAESDKVEMLDNFMVRSRDHPEVWPLLDLDNRHYGDLYGESASESEGLYNDDLSGYQLYEGQIEKKDGQHIWDEGESGQYDGDYTWDEEEEDEMDDVSELDTSFQSKFNEDMGRLSLEVM